MSNKLDSKSLISDVLCEENFTLIQTLELYIKVACNLTIKMYKQLIPFFLTIFIIFHLAIAKNSTKISSNSKSSSINKDKKNDRLPNRKGSFTRDSIFDELLNNKAGPPRKKRVRTTYQNIHLSHPTFMVPGFKQPAFNPQVLQYQNPISYNYIYPGRILPSANHPGLLPIHHRTLPLSTYNPSSNPQNSALPFFPIPYLTHNIPHNFYTPAIYSNTQQQLVTPYFLFSKCAGLEDFPETISKLAAQFSTLDEDKNGLLSKDEWERDILKQIENTNSGINHRFVHSIFNQVDVDGNNKMDFTELLQAIEMEGVNKDGEINQIEFEFFWLKSQVSGGQPLIQDEETDVNRSGSDESRIDYIAFILLDLDENNRITYTEFLQLDLDRDGEVGYLEFYYFLSRLALENDAERIIETDNETEYISKWLKEAKKLPLKMLKLSFVTFDQADVDFNGDLDSLEYLRLKEKVIIAYSEESHKLLFDLNDLNGDGFITIEEEEALLSMAESEGEEEDASNETNFVKFGPYINENDELKPQARLMLRSDTNGDGKISKEEYIAQSEANIKCHINKNNIQLISDVLAFDMTISF